MTNEKLFDVLKDFAPISLDQLNASMSLMERVEKKYLVSLVDLGEIMKKFRDSHFILSIKNNSIFTYDNIYMDTSDFFFFHQHEQGKSSRLKVRTREYVDSNIAFFECKQREGGLVRKSRYSIPVSESKEMTNSDKAFYQNLCVSFDLPYAHADTRPTMRTLYKRITLCSKKNDERITIDFDIHIQDVTKSGCAIIPLGPVVIIETKSSHKKSHSHDVLSQMKYKAAGGCSKYCLGILYSGHISTTKHFKKTINFIDNLNKPIQKIKAKVNNNLKTFKGTVVKKITETKENPVTIKKSITSKVMQKKKPITSKVMQKKKPITSKVTTLSK